MRFYLDTEFIDKGHTLDLISIGVVAEDGREYYAISLDFNPNEASDWVHKHVLAKLEPRDSGLWKLNKNIRDDLIVFVGSDVPAFWTWGGGTFDWFTVIQIFGGSDHLPDGWLYFANDLMQWCGQMGLRTDDPRIPVQADGAHNALTDARHNRAIYEYLSCYQHEWIIQQAHTLSS
jgi:hypothetical protein